MRKVLITFVGLCCLMCFNEVKSQELAKVTAKGLGIAREDALQDALRNAVGQAVGVAISSESVVEDFILVKDAISTNTKGYIKGYEVLEEKKLADSYTLTISAQVSLDPLKADVKTLSQQIGGVRFLVMFDKRKIPEKDIPMYNYAVERINEYLASKSYRYIEKHRFEELQQEALKIMSETDTSTLSFTQKLGFLSGAQFIVLVSGITTESRSEAFDTRTASLVSVHTKAYDNCTAEGLGTVVLKGNWNSGGSQGGNANLKGVEDAVKNNMDNLLSSFNIYIGDWVNNGAPFELRFYSIGTFRDFRDLRTSLRSNPKFGGQLEITSVNNYTRINCTIKDLPDEVAYSILDYADQIPEFKSKVLDVKLIYGRQISFAPRDKVVPEIQAKSEM